MSRPCRRAPSAWRDIRRQQAIADWRKIMLESRLEADALERAGNRAAAKQCQRLVRLAWRRLQRLTTRQ